MDKECQINHEQKGLNNRRDPEGTKEEKAQMKRRHEGREGTM